MRASLMLHLPSLQQNGMIKRISDNLSKLGLTLRGTYGEGTEPVGALYQLSNQVTLGLSEKRPLKIWNALSCSLWKKSAILEKKSDGEHEKARCCSKVFGCIKSAKILSTEEFMKLLSNVRLGVASGFYQRHIL